MDDSKDALQHPYLVLGLALLFKNSEFGGGMKSFMYYVQDNTMKKEDLLRNNGTVFLNGAK